MKSEDFTYTYETKCRRCGNFEEWYFGEKKQISKSNFTTAMVDHIANPRVQYCKKCEKHTVQEVVSVSE